MHLEKEIWSKRNREYSIFVVNIFEIVAEL